MSQNRYYQEELTFLREMGREFARAHPAAGRFLAERGSDPDVERLLEGFAFLTGRIREKLDDEFPEIIQGLMHMMWPHYLRPIPAMSILKFEPIRGMVKEVFPIPAGTEADAVPVQGISARFRTAYDVTLLPLELLNAHLEKPAGKPQQIRLEIKMADGVDPRKLVFDTIRFHLVGDPAFDLYLWLCRYVGRISIRYESREKRHHCIHMPSTAIQPVGFERAEALWPYPDRAFDGYRYLQEFFAFPEKFLFIDLKGFSSLRQMELPEKWQMVFELSRPFPGAYRIGRDQFQLNCTPVLNLFAVEADPIRVMHNKSAYRIRPEVNDATYSEIYSVNQVSSWRRGSLEEKTYLPFYSFRHVKNRADTMAADVFYHTHLRPSVSGQGNETYISFVNAARHPVDPKAETVSMKLTCMNRRLASQLKIGDIRIPTDSTPEFARFENITPVRTEIPAPFGQHLYWRLLSHMSLNYLSLIDVDAIKNLLSLYNYRALFDQQVARAHELMLEGLQSISRRRKNRLFRGVPVRGTRIEMAFLEDRFACDGELFLFSSVLNHFFSLYVSVNSFTELVVKGVQKGETYQWTPHLGKQPMI